jgi:MerR family transcriptional regulator, aldehyde-responsive regulator
MDEDWVTIAEAAARSGLPESTLRYWERIGLVNRVRRDASSGHRRYRPEDVATLETLGHLRAVGLSIEDMRRLADEVAVLELRRRYLDLKVRYWAAREAGDLDKAAAVAEELAPIIRHMNPKDNA